MFEKGRRRESKGLAVLYFIIGLIILLIILGIIYFALVRLDYSDQITNPNAQMRSYVAATPEPASAALVSDDQEGEELSNSVLFPGIDGNTSGQSGVRATAEPTPEPTETPAPTATPEPTPEPTAIPSSMLSRYRTSGYSLPASASANGVIGITQCDVSAQNDNRVMHLAGYGYVNIAAFDGTRASSFMIVSQRTTGITIAYELSMVNGVSGLSHSSALCANPAACDYEMYIDVSTFPDDIYGLSLVIMYQAEGATNTTYAYYPFSSDVCFTVLDGQVVTPVATVGDWN